MWSTAYDMAKQLPERSCAPNGATAMTRLDVAIVLTYLGGLLVFSYILQRRRPRADVFLAGRTMGWFPIGLSVMITLFSAVNFVAFPTEVMAHGLYVLAALPVFVLVAFPVTRWFIPFFYSMRLTSLYAYLECRFDRRTRLLAAGWFIFWRLCWMATALYASAHLLALITGWPLPVWLVAAGGVAAGYTAWGGIRTVMWTDVCQFALLMTGIGGALWWAIATATPGAPGLWATLHEHGRLQPFYPFDPTFLSWRPTVRISLWSGLIGTFVAFLTRYGADQMVVQRYFTARDLGAAVRGFWWNVWAALAALLLLLGLGLVITGGHTFDPDIPAMAAFGGFVRSLPFGLTGIVAAGLLAATMSSVDSGLNAALAVWMTDFEGRTLTDGSARRYTARYRSLLTGLALATIGLAFAVSRIGDLFAIINRVINGIGSPLLALLLLAMFSKRCTATGAWWGGLIGTGAAVTISFGWEGLALHYYAVVNLLVTLAACLIVSAGPCRPGNRNGARYGDVTDWLSGKIKSLGPGTLWEHIKANEYGERQGG